MRRIETKYWTVHLKCHCRNVLLFYWFRSYMRNWLVFPPLGITIFLAFWFSVIYFSTNRTCMACVTWLFNYAVWVKCLHCKIFKEYVAGVNFNQHSVRLTPLFFQCLFKILFPWSACFGHRSATASPRETLCLQKGFFYAQMIMKILVIYWIVSKSIAWIFTYPLASARLYAMVCLRSYWGIQWDLPDQIIGRGPQKPMLRSLSGSLICVGHGKMWW